MGFKSDREFLRNVSIGAVGTRQVAAILNRGGFDIIELERYSASNKIWATKIKRLRVPDLLCLKTGARIEARGKSNLVVMMSHAENDPNRAWDKGLRDGDLIAFNRLWPDGDGWKASDRLALFKVGALRATRQFAKTTQRKSASEGSEISLAWPAVVPSKAGVVTEVQPTKIVTLIQSTNRKQSYPLQRKNGPQMTSHVKVGETFGNGDTIIASVMPTLVLPTAPKVKQYDFLRDLKSKESETAYIAVKALGFLPSLLGASVTPLIGVLESHDDGRVRLEAAASLARLGLDQGWQYLAFMVRNEDSEPEYRMETALILSEQPSRRSTELLSELAESTTNPSELRAAGAWGLAAAIDGLNRLIPLTADADELTAVHAIAASRRVINDGNIVEVLQRLGDDDRLSAGLTRAILDSDATYVPEAVKQICGAKPGARRQWLLYLLAASGRSKCAEVIPSHPELEAALSFFWTHHGDNWTNRLDASDQINFLEQQTSQPL